MAFVLALKKEYMLLGYISILGSSCCDFHAVLGYFSMRRTTAMRTCTDLPGTVNKNFASAVLRAYVISSVLYAGLAPETTPPALMAPNMAHGYQTVLGENSATVWPCLRPYFLTNAVDR
jgi:hypothetical protein